MQIQQLYNQAQQAHNEHDIYRTQRGQPATSAKSQQNITLNQWTVGIHSRGNPGFPAKTLHGNMISFQN